MPNKQINELTEKTTPLMNDDLLVVYDSEEGGTEKTKKVLASNTVTYIPSTWGLYVATTGSDTTGDGSVGNPWATPWKALEWLSTRYINPIDGWVVINIADGTYNGSASGILFRMATNRVQILGNSGTPANVVINFITGSAGVYVHGSQSFLYVEGLKLVGYDKNEWQNGFQCAFGACGNMTNCIVDNFGNGVLAHRGSHISVNNSTFNNCLNGVAGYQQGDVHMINGTLSNNNNGASGSEQGRVITNGVTYTNNVLDTYTATDGLVTVL